MLAIVFDHLKKNCCQYTKCFVLHNHSTVDETTDCSNKEQVVLVLRLFDCDFNVCEDFIGLYNVPSISTNVLTSVIKDALQHLDLCISKVYGQCYNGASNMSGGVAKQILDEEKHASFTHCYDHALTLACNDAVKGCKILRDALETTWEITKLIKFLPKRDVLFQEKKQELSPDGPGVRMLCPTQWTVRGDSLDSVLWNYTTLQDTFEESRDAVSDTETKSCLIGVSAQMRTFAYLFGAMLGECILKHTANLSRSFQCTNISTAEDQELAVSILQSIRTDAMYEQFWEKVQLMCESVDVDPASLPRKGKPQKVLK